MKKLIFAMLIFAFMMVGCSKKPSAGSSIDTSSIQTNPITTGYDLGYFTEQSTENELCIEVPIWNGDNAEAFNQATHDFIVQKLQETTENTFEFTLSNDKFIPNAAQYSNYGVELSATVCTPVNKCQSIIYEGYVCRKVSAHPIEVYWVLNINTETGNRLRFEDLYPLNHSIYELFADAAKKQLIDEIGEWPDNWGEFESEICSYEKFLTGLQSESAFSWYPTIDGVVISCPVAHPMGDHLEVDLKMK